MVSLLLPDGVVLVFQKLLIYWDSTRTTICKIAGNYEVVSSLSYLEDTSMLDTSIRRQKHLYILTMLNLEADGLQNQKPHWVPFS